MTDTRDDLLEATRRCIAASGLAGTTSRDITAAARANLAAITYHFGSKEELVAQALLEGLRSWLEPALQALTSDGNQPQRAILAIQALLASFEDRRADAPGFLQALVEAPRIAPLHAGLIELWADLRSLLAAQIRDMQQSGELDEWVEPEAMAGLITAVANGLVLQVTVDPDGPSLTDMAGQFGFLLLNARTPGHA